VSHLRRAEWAVLVGAAGLLVTLFLDWYEGPAGTALAPNTSGWSSLGWFTVMLLVICIVAGLLLCALIAADAVDAFTLPPGVTLAMVGVPALLVLLLVLLFQPGLGTGLPNEAVTLQPAGWIGTACAVLLVAGGLLSLHDERTTGADRAFTPPTPRPAPPA
jgi:hypothetical protein